MQITLKNPLDMHLHLRDGAMLEAVAPFSAKSFAAAVIMPNLTPPIDSLESAKAYKQAIVDSISNYAKAHKQPLESLAFEPLCALYITDSLTPKVLESCANSGFKLLKLYPKGATTNSDNGIAQVLDGKMRALFSTAQDQGMILCIHGESGGFVLEREMEFGAVLRELATSFPSLKIIIEHISDHRTIPLLKEYDNLYATITLHHITLDLNDVAGGMLCHHHFCKPVLKTPKDKQALLELALSAHSKVCFGSDSAPHSLESKQKGAAGIFSAPALLPQLAELFDKHNALHNLQAFVSDNAMKIYDLSLWVEAAKSWEKSPKLITLEKSPCHIPESIPCLDSSLRPLRAGEMIAWRESGA